MASPPAIHVGGSTASSSSSDRLQQLSYATNFYRAPSSNPVDRENEGLRLCMEMDNAVNSILLPTNTTGHSVGINFDDITQRINVIMRNITSIVSAKPPEQYAHTYAFSHVYCFDINLANDMISKVTIHLPGVAASNLRAGRLGPVEHIVHKNQSFTKSDTTFGFLIEKKIYTNIHNTLTGEVGQRLGNLLEQEFAPQEQSILTSMRKKELERLFAAIALQIEGVRNGMLRGQVDNNLRFIRSASPRASHIDGLSRLAATEDGVDPLIAARLVYESVLSSRFVLDRSPSYFMEHVIRVAATSLSNHYIMPHSNAIVVDGFPVDAIMVTTRSVKDTLSRNQLLKSGTGHHSLTRKLLLFTDEQANAAPLAKAIPVDENNIISRVSDYVFSRDVRHNNDQVRYLMENQPIYSNDNVPMSYLSCDGKIILVESIDENYDQTKKANPLINNMSKTIMIPLGMKVTDVKHIHYDPITQPDYPSSIHVGGDDGSRGMGSRGMVSRGMVSLSSTIPYFAFSEFLYSCDQKEGKIPVSWFPLSTVGYKNGDINLVCASEDQFESRVIDLSERVYADMDNRDLVERECHPYFNYAPYFDTEDGQIYFSPRHRLFFGNIPSYMCPLSYHLYRGRQIMDVYGRRPGSLLSVTEKDDYNRKRKSIISHVRDEVSYINSRFESELTLGKITDKKRFYSSATELYGDGVVGGGDDVVEFTRECAVYHYMTLPFLRITQPNTVTLSVSFLVDHKDVFLRKHATSKSVYDDGLGFLSIPLSSFYSQPVEVYPDADPVDPIVLFKDILTKKKSRGKWTIDSTEKVNEFLESAKTLNQDENYSKLEKLKETLYKAADTNTVDAMSAWQLISMLVHAIMYSLELLAVDGHDLGDGLSIAQGILNRWNKRFVFISAGNDYREKFLATITTNYKLTCKFQLLESQNFVDMERKLAFCYTKHSLTPSLVFGALYSRCQKIDPLTTVSCLRNNIGVCAGICLVKSEICEAHDALLVSPGSYEMYTGPTNTVPYDTNDVSIQTDVKCSYLYTKNVLNHGSLLMQHLIRGETRTDSGHFVVGNMSTFHGKPRNAEAIVAKVYTKDYFGNMGDTRMVDFLQRAGSGGYHGSNRTGPTVDGRLMSQASVVLAPCVVSSYFFNSHVSLRGFDNMFHQNDEKKIDTVGDGYHSWNPYSSNTLSVNNRCYGALPKELVNSHCLTFRSHRNRADIFKFFATPTRRHDDILKAIVHDHRILSRMSNVTSMMRDDASCNDFNEYYHFCMSQSSNVNSNSTEPINDDVTLQRVSIPFCYTSEDILRRYQEDMIRDAQIGRVNKLAFSRNAMMDMLSGSEYLHDTL